MVVRLLALVKLVMLLGFEAEDVEDVEVRPVFVAMEVDVIGFVLFTIMLEVEEVVVVANGIEDVNDRAEFVLDMLLLGFEAEVLEAGEYKGVNVAGLVLGEMLLGLEAGADVRPGAHCLFMMKFPPRRKEHAGVEFEFVRLLLDNAALELARILLKVETREVGLELAVLLLEDTGFDLVRLKLEGVKDDVWLELGRLLPDVVLSGMVVDVAVELTIPVLDGAALAILVLDDAALELRRLLLEGTVEDFELELATLLLDDADFELARLPLVDDDEGITEDDKAEVEDMAEILLEADVLEDNPADDVVMVGGLRGTTRRQRGR